MGNLWMSFNIRIVLDDIPIILGIQDMDRLCLYFNNLTDKMIYPRSGFSDLTIRSRAHDYMKWDPQIQRHFTTAELHKLHRRFGKPSD